MNIVKRCRMGEKSVVLLVTQWVFVLPAFLVVLLRLYVRVLRRRLATWDDVCIFVALVMSLFGAATGQIFVPHGIGQHSNDITPQEMSTAMKWLVICQIENSIGLFFVRMSVGFFLLRVLPSATKDASRWRHLAVLLMVINFVHTAVATSVTGTQCIPLKAVWDQDVVAKKCVDAGVSAALNRFFGATSACIDFAFALLPLTVLRRMKASLTIKAGTGVCLFMGGLAGACAVARACSVRTSPDDRTYNLWCVTMCAMLEINLAIVAASMPAMLEVVRVTREDIKRFRAKKNAVELKDRKPSKAGDSRGSLDHPNGDRRESTIVFSKHTDITVSFSPRERPADRDEAAWLYGGGTSHASSSKASSGVEKA